MSKSSSNLSAHHEKGLLADARRGDLHHMKKRMRNSIFKRAEDVNQKDERHCTPLHYAAKNGHLDMIRFLLEKGADLAAADKHGWSVLQYAVRYSTPRTVETLIDLGAALGHVERKGWTCLHLAARNGQADIARLLLERGANVDQTQDQGWNALHLAVRYGQPDTISTLLEYGIDINAANRGWTALHLAALNGHTDIASILLNKGAETDAENAEGQSPLDIARAEGKETIAAIILEAEFQGHGTQNVSTTTPTSRGRRPLPTPPPTPPSAPPLEMLMRPGSADETLQEWEQRMRSQLDNLEGESSPDNSLEDDDDDDDEDEDSVYEKINTIDVRITWKTFEEEAKELMNQLERLRLKEVNKVKSQLVKCRKEFGQKMVRLEKRRHLLLSQIDKLKSDIPLMEDRLKDRIDVEKEKIRDIDRLIDANYAEGQIIEALLKKRVKNVPDFFKSVAGEKCEIIESLCALQVKSEEKLREERRAALRNIDSHRERKEAEVNLMEEKVRVLERNLTELAAKKAQLELEREAKLRELAEQLEKAERKSVLQTTSQSHEEHWFGCPVCLLLLKPPIRIFQCPEGHILCEECKENPAMVHCPQCRCSLEGQCSRNRALEEVARSYFPMAPSETL